MDVRELAGIKRVQNPSGNRRTEIAMQCRHRAVFDVALKARSHDELAALPEFFQKRRNLTEIVGQVGISEQNVFSPDERDGVDVGAAEPTFPRLEDSRSAGSG